MAAIGIDTHKATLAACAVDERGAALAEAERMRLNRGGNRQLNRALFTAAFVQSRHHPPAIAFMARKRTEGKSWREALRCLKRHVARRVYRLLNAPATSIEMAA